MRTMIRANAASDPRTPHAKLLELAAEYPAEVAANPGALRAPSLWLQADLFAGLSLASLPSAPAPVFEALSRHPRHEIRAAVAQNAASPALLLARLCFDDSDEVRSAAAHNPSTPAPYAGPGDAMDAAERRCASQLLTSEERAASASYAPPTLLRAVAARGGHLRRLVLLNSGCPDDLLAQEAARAVALAARVSPLQAATASGILDPAHGRICVRLLSRFIREIGLDEPLLLAVLAPRQSLSPSAGVFSECDLKELLDQVLDCGRPSTSVLGAMARHPLSVVRLEAARCAGLPAALLPGLLGDRCHDVRRAAYRHPKLGAAWRERLGRLGLPPGLPPRSKLTGALEEADREALRAAGPWLRALAGV